jgi:hypothetical protein
MPKNGLPQYGMRVVVGQGPPTVVDVVVVVGKTSQADGAGARRARKIPSASLIVPPYDAQ